MSEDQSYSVLRVYASTTDKAGMRPLYEHIVHLAREQGISGATVYRGVMGYGASSKHISSSKFWELTEKLPVVIELVDRTAKLKEFYELIKPELHTMRKGCLVSIQPVDVMHLQPGKPGNG